MMNGNMKNPPIREVSKWKRALSQIFAVSVKNIVLLGYGMTLGFPTLLIPALSGNDEGEKFSLDQEGLSWIGSIGLICVPFGCFFSGIITQPIGRKRAMQLINLPFIMAWLLFYFSTEMWHIFTALAITGLAGGLMEAPVLTYVAEVTQPHLRGILSSTSSMSVMGGLMVQFILATFLKWRTVALFNTIIPILSFNLLFLIPETPIWLITKRRYDEAKKSLAWLRGWVPIENIENEYKELLNMVEQSKAIGNNETTGKRSKLETLKLFKKDNFIKPFCLVSYIFFLSHFNGMSPIQTYAVAIFKTFHAPINKYYATAILGIVEVFGCITCVTLVYYVGKRVLVLISLIGTSLCFLIIAIYTHLNNINYLLNLNNNNNQTTIVNIDNNDAYSWLPMIVLISAAYISHMGIRILPWILTGEIFPNETRAIASGLAATNSYIFGFLCNKTFLSMVSHITLPGSLGFYSLMSFIGLIILYFYLPETEGKTLQEITDHFSGKSKLGNHVNRKRKNVNGIDNRAFENEKKFDFESKL